MMKPDKHVLPWGSLALLCLVFLLSGCIRLWGGAGYYKKTPEEEVSKTYILDTYELTRQSESKGHVQTA